MTQILNFLHGSCVRNLYYCILWLYICVQEDLVGTGGMDCADVTLRSPLRILWCIIISLQE